MNKIIEALEFASDSYWGNKNRYQFRTYIDRFDSTNEYGISDQRIAKTNLSITLYGYIIPETINKPKYRHTFTNQDHKNIKRTGHKVQGKHLETGEIKIWESAALAAEEVTGNARKNSNIMTCARNCYKCYGYKWSVIEENSKKKPIFGIHKKTERLGPRYESVTEAMKELRGNSAGVGLTRSLKNPGKCSYRGFYWYYG